MENTYHSSDVEVEHEKVNVYRNNDKLHVTRLVIHSRDTNRLQNVYTIVDFNMLY